MMLGSSCPTSWLTPQHNQNFQPYRDQANNSEASPKSQTRTPGDFDIFSVFQYAGDDGNDGESEVSEYTTLLERKSLDQYRPPNKHQSTYSTFVKQEFALMRECVENDLSRLQHAETHQSVVAEKDAFYSNEDSEAHEIRSSTKSSLPITIFNCTNMLIGAGVLALPMGLHKSGWIVGLILLCLPAVVSAFTADLLVECIRACETATTYSDIAYFAFGSFGSMCIDSLFILELVAANVAFIILFADSAVALMPFWSPTLWKIVIAVTMIPLNFVRLRTLSVGSILGIFCFLGIVTTLFSTGSARHSSPGSFWQPASTTAMPSDMITVLSSIGIFMAPWGGHSIVPVVYNDMEKPQHYHRALKWTYSITFSIAVSVAVMGYLMFGGRVCPEITSNILQDPSYPGLVHSVTIVLVGLIPVTKIALTNRPVIESIRQWFEPVSRLTAPAAEPRRTGKSSWKRIAIGVLCNVVELGLALLLPGFDDVVSMMGSAFCVTICVVFPGAFWLKLMRNTEVAKMRPAKVFFVGVMVLVGAACSVVGTWASVVLAFS